MNLKDWERTIRQIVDESNSQPKGTRKDHLLMEWRVKLEKGPTLLQPYQIDEIVREARRRLSESPVP